MEKVCQVTIVHKEKVNVIKNKLDQKDFSNLLVLGKCFSDSSRIKIFYALETYKEMCV
ncbi:TPA: transcriptional regulator, partial [Enterococcus faecium]|nr:transcriptional regulator [Enterococcus faecium]